MNISTKLFAVHSALMKQTKMVCEGRIPSRLVAVLSRAAQTGDAPALGLSTADWLSPRRYSSCLVDDLDFISEKKWCLKVT